MLSSDKILLAMVGLPARGKTYTSRKVQRLLEWRGYNAKCFNIGDNRRKYGIINEKASHSYFDNKNLEQKEEREKTAMEVLDKAFDFLEEDGQVAIFDGTNSTVQRRKSIESRLWLRFGESVKLVFLEIMCEEPSIIENNVRKFKKQSPDYIKSGMKEQEIVHDFMKRIKHYQERYQPLSQENESHLSYIRSMDSGFELQTNNLKGMLLTSILEFIINSNLETRPFYFSRHGLSEFNKLDKIGGNSQITKEGHVYAKMLVDYFTEEQKSDSRLKNMKIYTSSLMRTQQTALPLKEKLNLKHFIYRKLDEIDAGICDGMTFEEVKKKMPDVFEKRKKDKLGYRYPRGESYLDLIMRLESMIYQLERSRDPVFVISHQAVMRCLYCYFCSKFDKKDVPFLEMPIHTVIKLTPNGYGYDQERIFFDVTSGKRRVLS